MTIYLLDHMVTRNWKLLVTLDAKNAMVIKNYVGVSKENFVLSE